MDKKEFDERLNALSERVLSKALTPDEETNYTESLFESIRHVNEYGQEFWYARELQIALEYKEWRNFCKVIDKAKTACESSENTVSECFVDVNKTSPMPNGGFKTVDDIALSRYACYLIVQNGDPRKKVIALGQSYFAVKTRQQELIDNYDNLNEDQKRLAIRKEMKEHNKLLVAAAKDAGVQSGIDYAIFQNSGYKGLYGGMTAKDTDYPNVTKVEANDDYTKFTVTTASTELSFEEQFLSMQLYIYGGMYNAFNNLSPVISVDYVNADSGATIYSGKSSDITN